MKEESIKRDRQDRNIERLSTMIVSQRPQNWGSWKLPSRNSSRLTRSGIFKWPVINEGINRQSSTSRSPLERKGRTEDESLLCKFLKNPHHLEHNSRQPKTITESLTTKASQFTVDSSRREAPLFDKRPESSVAALGRSPVEEEAKTLRGIFTYEPFDIGASFSRGIYQKKIYSYITDDFRTGIYNEF